MAIANRVADYMRQRELSYDVVAHPHSRSSMETAELAHVPGSRLAKSVILEDDDGYVMAVLPSTRHVRLGKLSREMNRRLHLASESQLAGIFIDCERGAVPPLGLAYGMPTIMDDTLGDQPEIYFEAGDHESLIRMSRDQFMMLMEHVGHGRFGHHGHIVHRA